MLVLSISPIPSWGPSRSSVIRNRQLLTIESFFYLVGDVVPVGEPFQAVRFIRATRGKCPSKRELTTSDVSRRHP